MSDSDSGFVPERPRIGILVVAYNAATTLSATLDRIPVDFRDRIAEVIILDDASHDDTFVYGQTWAKREDTPNTLVIRHTKNLGYGGNQKAGYRLAIERGLDIVVLLHGDGQYAPEMLPDDGRAAGARRGDAVFGSRMMDKGAARRGGMPLYKYARQPDPHHDREPAARHRPHRVPLRLPRLQRRRAARAPVRAQHTTASTSTPRSSSSCIDAGKRIEEIPIPTYYGDEICYVNGMKYAKDVVKRRRASTGSAKGFGTAQLGARRRRVRLQGRRRHLARGHPGHAGRPAAGAGARPRAAPAACSPSASAARGHHVTGVDYSRSPASATGVDEFVQADLEPGIPAEVGGGFDVVIAGDVIEHLPRPARSLRRDAALLRPGGQLMLSVPNFGHWYPRGRVALGLFGYDRRGILDETHLRFFTRSHAAPAGRAAAASTSSRSGPPACRWAPSPRRTAGGCGCMRRSTAGSSGCARRCSATSSSCG